MESDDAALDGALGAAHDVVREDAEVGVGAAEAAAHKAVLARCEMKAGDPEQALSLFRDAAKDGRAIPTFADPLARWIRDGPQRDELADGHSPEAMRMNVNLLCDIGDLRGAYDAIGEHVRREPAGTAVAMYPILALAAALRTDDAFVAQCLEATGSDADVFVQVNTYAGVGYAAAGCWSKAHGHLAAAESSCSSSGAVDVIRAAVAVCDDSVGTAEGVH